MLQHREARIYLLFPNGATDAVLKRFNCAVRAWSIPHIDKFGYAEQTELRKDDVFCTCSSSLGDEIDLFWQ